MIPTKDEIKEEARRQNISRNPFGGKIHYVSGEKDFIAGAEWVLQKLQQASVGRSKALELLGSVLDNVGEVSSCSLMHRGCVAFRTTDGKAYKLSIQPQDEVVLD